jgi:hypothetical protein
LVLSFQFLHETEKTKPKTHVNHVHTFDLFDYVGLVDRVKALDQASHKASAFVKTSARQADPASPSTICWSYGAGRINSLKDNSTGFTGFFFIIFRMKMMNINLRYAET